MKEKLGESKREVNNYLKYSGIGFQIAATIAVGVFIGYQLDKWLKTPQPYFTLSISFVFIILALVIGLKDWGKKGEK